MSHQMNQVSHNMSRSSLCNWRCLEVVFGRQKMPRLSTTTELAEVSQPCFHQFLNAIWQSHSCSGVETEHSASLGKRVVF